MIQTSSSDYSEQPPLAAEYDVVVLGAGPAGATAAALLAEAGKSVLMVDRAAFPRFHVGESLIPETYWPLKRLGLIDALKASAFPRKYSVQFISDGRKESAPFYFDEYNPHECSVTWQVVRADFDRMLTDNAVAKGAVFRNDAHALDVLFDGDRAVGVKLKLATGDEATKEVACKVVVDATGQSAFLVNRLKLKEPDANLRKGSIWTYWKGAYRDSGKDEGATLIMQTEGKKSWFWYIPLPDDVVSVGVTGNMDYLFHKQRGSVESVYAEERDRCPALARRLESAERIADFFTTKDYSYKVKRTAGDGWVVVGDAGGFIDPVYSSGVFLALKSGEFAADAIVEGLQRDDLSGAQLGCWRETYAAGVENFRKLVYAFYRPGFSFGMFLKEHPEYKSNLVDILIGNVFRPGVGEIFDAMGDAISPAM